MLPLTVWMNMPSFYQDDLFAALVATGRVDLQVIFAHPLSAERRALGWQMRMDRYAAHSLNVAQPLRHAVQLAWAGRQRCHIVNGIWAEPAFVAALCTLGLAGSSFAIYAEAPEPGQRSRLKQLLQRVFGGWVAQRACGLLAISYFARDYYATLGFRSAQLYPFGYFQAAPTGTSPTVPSASPEIVFVGQLVRRKGVDLLLAALPSLVARCPTLRLTLIGDGPMRPALVAQVAALGLEAHVTFVGVLPSPTVRAYMRAATALVLPSRWDGWGLVVNEALSVGVPVIVSDQCGAAELIEPGVQGYRFRSEDVADLQGALGRVLQQSAGEHVAMRRAAAARGAALATDVVTPYLVDCLRHMMSYAPTPRPNPPWLRVQPHTSS